jgi:hypothetical protein
VSFICKSAICLNVTNLKLDLNDICKGNIYLKNLRLCCILHIVCCRLCASDVHQLWALVHDSPAINVAWILIFMFVSPRSIISVSHSLNRESNTNGKISENEVLDKA